MKKEESLAALAGIRRICNGALRKAVDEAVGLVTNEKDDVKRTALLENLVKRVGASTRAKAPLVKEVLMSCCRAKTKEELAAEAAAQKEANDKALAAKRAEEKAAKDAAKKAEKEKKKAGK